MLCLIEKNLDFGYLDHFDDVIKKEKVNLTSHLPLLKIWTFVLPEAHF